MRIARLTAVQRQRGISRGLPSMCLFSVWREKCVEGKRKKSDSTQERRTFVRRRRKRGLVAISKAECSHPPHMGPAWSGQGGYHSGLENGGPARNVLGWGPAMLSRSEQFVGIRILYAAARKGWSCSSKKGAEHSLVPFGGAKNASGDFAGKMGSILFAPLHCRVISLRPLRG
jgi:hypothetical protein